MSGTPGLWERGMNFTVKRPDLRTLQQKTRIEVPRRKQPQSGVNSRPLRAGLICLMFKYQHLCVYIYIHIIICIYIYYVWFLYTYICIYTYIYICIYVYIYIYIYILFVDVYLYMCSNDPTFFPGGIVQPPSSRVWARTVWCRFSG